MTCPLHPAAVRLDDVIGDVVEDVVRMSQC